MANGIDISSCNGTIDFNAVRGQNIEYCIIKSSEGVDFKDNLVDQHYNGANGVIPHIGFYHYMSEKTSPSQQAEDFWNIIQGKTYDIIPTLDIEINNQGRNASQITDRCIEFINRFKELSNQDIMIYSGGYFSRDSLDDRLKGFKLWVAQYNGENGAIMETGFSNVVAKQFSESGHLAGISGNVDLNNFTEGVLLGSSFQGQVSGNVGQSSSDPVQVAKQFVGSRALELQQKLNRFGNYNLAEDGDIGQASYDAIIDAQGKLGVKQDGFFGDISWSALENVINGQSVPQPVAQVDTNGWVFRLQTEIVNQGFGNIARDNLAGNETLSHCPLLKYGCEGEITRLLQEKLNSLGYDTKGIDGKFYGGTEEAVRCYQADNKIDSDGEVFTQTWSKLLGLS